jgi:hypothetical protein
MNFKFILLFFCTNVLAYKTQAQVKTIYLSSFGAIANDNKSDHNAFNKAGEYINTHKGNIRLVISKGVYIVGVLPKSNNREDIPIGENSINDVINIKNCNNVTIEGEGKVIIKFADNIPVGTLPNQKNNKDSAVHIGSLFYLTSCTNVKFLNIIADGNNENFKLLKTWGIGNNPYERAHYGLFLLNCQNVFCNNVSYNNFVTDGALILEDEDKIPAKNISFTKCNFNKNGRNGVSWCGGENVNFYKCTFSNNATGKIVTNPGAGLDIEPERNALCKKGVFRKCEFTNNGGYAITSGYETASDVVFDSCIIIGNNVYALICQSPKFIFANSTFAGTCLFTYDSKTEDDGIKVINCTFADSIFKKRVFTLNYLVGILGRYIQFDSCSFNCYKVPILYTEIKKRGELNSTENTSFKNCSFATYFNKPSTWKKHAFLVSNANFENCSFKTTGIAEYKGALNEPGRNIQQKKSIFIGNK